MLTFPHICLVEPEIPQNTGAIARLAAATNCTLHLIKPLGFSFEDRYMKRAGLDYWPFLNLKVHENFDEMLATFDIAPRMAFFSTKADKPYWDLPPIDMLVFGKETAGLPQSLRERYAEDFCTIPMYNPNVRSLNLANSVSIVVYNQIQQRMMQR
jgi:tRNA (cytidine/uridine-2'-O-)-methyltransferase